MGLAAVGEQRVPKDGDRSGRHVEGRLDEGAVGVVDLKTSKRAKDTMGWVERHLVVEGLWEL